MLTLNYSKIFISTCFRQYFSTIIDGNYLAHQITSKVKHNIQFQKKLNPNIPDPCLGIILVGNNQASLSYVSKKISLCQMNQIRYVIQHLPQEISQKKLLETVQEVNRDSSINAILVQLPLPNPIDRFEILQSIDPRKDVDCLHTKNLQLIAQEGDQCELLPCTPAGILHILDTYHINVKNMKATIVGRGNLVGFPLSYLLLKRNAQVTICHKYTPNLQENVQKADLLISCVGIRHLIKGEWIKKGAFVIDVGINKGIPGLDQKKIVGDIEFLQASKRANLITPVPGGVGPMTVAMLLKNTYTLWCQQHGLNKIIKDENEGEYVSDYYINQLD